MPTAIITGASRGLGRALALDLAHAGWRLTVDGRNPPDLHAAMSPLGPAVTAVPGDIADAAHRRALVATAGDRLDLLVLNASTLGPSPLPPLAGYDLDRLREVFEVNVVAALGLTQLALPALRTVAGRVIFVTSDAAVEAYEGWGGYGASKAALEAFSRVLAGEEPGLRVYAVDPGDLRTQMHQEAFPGEDISDRPEPDTVVPGFRRLIDGDLPSGRYRAPDLTGAHI
jgi:NAD(P)-dependent dehydrogenase (short-subunit alcohol dehydrogenase family)